MKYPIFLIFVLAIVFPLAAQTGDASAFTAEDCKPMIIVCNLSRDNVNIMIGDDETTVFYTDNLQEFDTTALVSVDYTGTYTLYDMYPEDWDWLPMYRSETEEEYTVTLREGKILALLITPDNDVYDFELSYNYNGYGKVMFANLSEYNMAMMEVAKEFGDHNVVWSQNLNYYTLSNFGDAPSGSYGLFWQTSEMLEDEDYYFYPDDDGNPEMKEVTWGKWYQMMVYDKDGKSTCTFFDITPEQSFLKE
jgi:hypothetical protein